jgi:hypothetical protein
VRFDELLGLDEHAARAAARVVDAASIGHANALANDGARTAKPASPGQQAPYPLFRQIAPLYNPPLE